MTRDQFDIYISYAPEDQDRVRKVVEELEWAGLKVWFRNHPATAQESIDLLNQTLDTSKVHLVVWSRESAASGRIQAEARAGSLKRRLIAVRIDMVLPPKGTDAITYADLTNWEGGQDHRQFKKLLHGIHRLIGKGVAPDQLQSQEATFTNAPISEWDMLSDDEKDDRAWQIATSYRTKTYYQHYLNHFPRGKYVEKAREEIAKKNRTGRIVLTCAIIWIVGQIIFAIAVQF
ncbi:MAG: toll/interleukin-1 receptor domain-containing protein [Bacteroidota bacterium]